MDFLVSERGARIMKAEGWGALTGIPLGVTTPAELGLVTGGPEPSGRRAEAEAELRAIA